MGWVPSRSVHRLAAQHSTRCFVTRKIGESNLFLIFTFLLITGDSQIITKVVKEYLYDACPLHFSLK